MVPRTTWLSRYTRSEGPPGSEGSTSTCNFSDAAYQQLAQEIQANPQNEIMKNVGNILLPLLELNCTQYLNGFNGQSKEKPTSNHLVRSFTSVVCLLPHLGTTGSPPPVALLSGCIVYNEPDSLWEHYRGLDQGGIHQYD